MFIDVFIDQYFATQQILINEKMKLLVILFLIKLYARKSILMYYYKTVNMKLPLCL